MLTARKRLLTGSVGSVSVYKREIGGESMAKKRLTKKVGFRMEDEEFRLAQRLAAGKDLSPGDWCRQVVREKLAAICAQASGAPSSSMVMTSADVGGNQKQKLQRMSEGEVILFLESVRLRWLLQEFLDYLSRAELTPKAGRFLVDQTNRVNGPATEFARKWLKIYDGLDRKPTN
jgi:hypothetical protein